MRDTVMANTVQVLQRDARGRFMRTPDQGVERERERRDTVRLGFYRVVGVSALSLAILLVVGFTSYYLGTM